MEKNSDRLVKAFGIGALFIAALVLVGWGLDIPWMKTILPGYISMKANTALGIGLNACAILLLRQKSSRLVPLALALSAGAAFLGIATLGEYYSAWNLGIDEFLVADPDGIHGRFPPGRMAPITAINFIFLFVAMGIGLSQKKKNIWIAQCIDLSIFVIAIQAFVSSVLGLRNPLGYSFYTQMALHTTVSFALLSSAHFFLHQQAGFAAALLADSAAGRVTRRLFVTVLTLSPALNIFVVTAQFHGWLDQESSILFRVTSGVAILTMVVFRSAMELHKVELEQEFSARNLFETKERLERALAFAPVVLWSTDAKGIFSLQTGKGLQDMGLKQNQFVGQSIFDIFPADHITIEAIKRAQSGQQFEYSAEFADRSVDTVVSPIFGPNGQVTEVLGVTVDVTAHKHAQQERMKQLELKREKEQAEASTKAKSIFLANMSHEVRTPINGLMGMCWLLSETELNEEQRDYVTRIKRSSESLLRIVNDILDFSKVEAGKLQLEPRSFSVEELMGEINLHFDHQARSRENSFASSFARDIPPALLGDPGRVQQVLRNLISNALKFTSRGSVTVHGGLTKITNGTAYVRFSVKDTGIGVAPELRPVVFGEFQQGDSSTTRIYGGTGLGLSICKKLVELMGGTIGFETEVGRGSEFWFQLPFKVLAAGVSDSEVIEIRPERARAEAPRVLVAEDDETNAEITQRMLKRMGYLSLLVKNGRDAVTAIEKEDFALVLMDCNMPVMDGYEATSAIRGHARPEIKEMKVIALTASAVAGSKERCFMAGMNGFLSKPFSYAELEKAVVEAVAPEEKLAA